MKKEEIFQLLDKGHSTIVGQTGSGKSFFAEKALEYLSRSNYIFVHDYKDEFLMKDSVKCYGLKELEKNFLEKKIVFVPTDEAENESVFDCLFRGKNRILYVDEAYSLGAKGVMPESFLKCLTRGRSRNIRVITATQRPVWASNFILSEAQTLVLFHLSVHSDREKIKKICNIDTIDCHDFIFKLVHKNKFIGEFKL